MIYRIIEKPTGVKNTTPIVEIESSTIKDFCYVDDLGILFVYDQCIGLIPLKGDPVVPWRGEEGTIRKEWHESYFNDPCSITYNPYTRNLYVIEKGGSRIRELEDLSSGVDFIKGEDGKTIDVLFSKVNAIGSARSVLRGQRDLIWIAPDIHRCLIHTDSMISIFAGDGRGRYAVANSPIECSFHTPSDILSINQDILIADLDNFCVRRINDNGVTLFCGNPSRPDLHPRRMALKDNIIYVLSGNEIKSFPMVQNRHSSTGSTIYESENIVDLTAGKKGLLILEVVK